MRVLGSCGVTVLCALVTAGARPAAACAPAPPLGEVVVIAEEEAVILWDRKAKVEHFIRRADFRSTARSFGFLVPTPTTPTLGEVSGDVFATIAERIQPPVTHERHHSWKLGSLVLDWLGATASKSTAVPDGVNSSSVRVIATAHVAGFEATTVEASDAGALAAWLGKHGFASTPALTEWLARYVEQKWKITAFVVATDEGETTEKQYGVATRAVRMTFHTDRPVYPYREPAAGAPQHKSIDAHGRALRVHFLSNERYDASLAGAPWSAKVIVAADFATKQGLAIRQLAGLGDHLTFLTTFVDESYPRRATDEVYFVPSTDENAFRQPSILIQDPEVTTIPVDLILVLAIVAFLVARHLRRPSVVG